MGAWGYGYFENDGAFDFMADIEESENPKALIVELIEGILQYEYTETSDGESLIVAAAYADRQLNGTTFSDEGREEPLDVDTFPARHPEVDFSDLLPSLIAALKKVMGEDSELKELWEETDDYESWMQEMNSLLARLEAYK